MKASVVIPDLTGFHFLWKCPFVLVCRSPLALFHFKIQRPQIKPQSALQLLYIAFSLCFKSAKLCLFCSATLFLFRAKPTQLSWMLFRFCGTSLRMAIGAQIKNCIQLRAGEAEEFPWYITYMQASVLKMSSQPYLLRELSPNYGSSTGTECLKISLTLAISFLTSHSSWAN